MLGLLTFVPSSPKSDPGTGRERRAGPPGAADKDKSITEQQKQQPSPSWPCRLVLNDPSPSIAACMLISPAAPDIADPHGAHPAVHAGPRAGSISSSGTDG